MRKGKSLLMLAFCCSLVFSWQFFGGRVEAEEIKLEPFKIKTIEYGSEGGVPFNQYCNRIASTNPYCIPNDRVVIALGYDENLDYTGKGVVQFNLNELEGKIISKAYLSTYIESVVPQRHYIHIKYVTDDSWSEDDTEIPEDYSVELMKTNLVGNKINTFEVTDFIKAELAGDKQASFLLDSTDLVPEGQVNENMDIQGWGHSNPEYDLHLIIETASSPTDIELSNKEVEEKEPISTTVGTLSANDEDTDDTFTYQIVGGDTNAFYIAGNALQTSAVFDYSIKNSYEIMIRVTDSTGNTFEKSFTIQVKQNEPPTGTITINGGAEFTNSTVVTLNVTANDANGDPIEIRLKDSTGDWEEWEPFVNGKTWTLPTGEGLKTVELQLRDSKSTQPDTYSDSIIVDTTPPTGSIGINSGALYTNNTIVQLSLTANDVNTPIMMQLSNDGMTWSSWETFSTSKNWTLASGDGEKTAYMKLKDGAGNISENYMATIIVDTTPPIVTGVTNGGVYNSDVTISFEGTATLNGSVFVSESTVKDDGFHSLIVTDNAGNTTEVIFIIDKTPPEVTGVEDGKFYNTTVTITFNEGTATLNGHLFSQGTVNTEGNHTLVVTDLVGNTTTIQFIIDTTAPNVTGVVDGTTYNTDVTISFNEGTATLNGNPFTSGTTVNMNGNHTLVVTDIAENQTTILFSIDTLGPVVTFDPNGSSQRKEKHVTRLTVVDEGSDVSSIEYQWTKTKDFPATGTWLSLEENFEISLQNVNGDYYLHVLTEDKIGNQTKITSESFNFSHSSSSSGGGHSSRPSTPEIFVNGNAKNDISVEIVNGKVLIKPKASNRGLVLNQSEQIGNILLICYGITEELTNRLLELTASNDIKKIFVIYDDQPYQYLDIRANTPADKEWNISFNQALDVNSINGENVFVTDQQGNAVDFEVQISQDGKSIKLIPNTNYEKGEVYLLNVMTDVK